MLVYILAGLYALILQRIEVPYLPRLREKHARNFGLTLLIGAFPISLITSVLFIRVLPEGITSISFLMRVINALVAVVICVGLMYPFRMMQVKAADQEKSQLRRGRSGSKGAK